MRPSHFSTLAPLTGSTRGEDPRGPWASPSGIASGPACWVQRDDSMVRRWLQASGASASTTAAVIWDEERDEVGYAEEDYAVFFEDEELNDVVEEREAA